MDDPTPKRAVGEGRRFRLKSTGLPRNLKVRIWIGKLVLRRPLSDQSVKIHRLPFSKVLKMNCHPSELEAMVYVRRHTTIPIPRILEIYEDGNKRHLVMEQVKALPLRAVIMHMTGEQIDLVAKDFAKYLAQLRALVPPQEGSIGSTSLGSGLDHSLGIKRFGPFNSVAEFHTYIRRNRPVEHWSFEPDIVKVHNRPARYTTKYAHGDLHASNILVDGCKVVAIVDWEFAGWFPEYWDYAKLFWSQRYWERPFTDALEPLITSYPEEYAAELAFWKWFMPHHYDAPHSWTGSQESLSNCQEPADERETLTAQDDGEASQCLNSELEELDSSGQNEKK